MSDSNYDDVLIHHGVKGMKWGVRRSQAALDRAAGRVSSDARVVRELKKKPASALSNQQLKTINERLNLETNYNRLNPSTVKRGTQFIKGGIGILTTGVALYNLSNSPAGKKAIDAGSKAIKKMVILHRARRAFA